MLVSHLKNFAYLVILVFCVSAQRANAYTLEDSFYGAYKVYPANDSLANKLPNATGPADALKEFNWQLEWGSIHMNSYADGLNDPGSLASGNGEVPCKYGVICDVMKHGKSIQGKVIPLPKALPQDKSQVALENGIKFDIKHSLNNCMAQPLPTWAYNNQWRPWTDGQFGPCQERWGLSWPSQYTYNGKFPKDQNDNSSTGFPHTMVYAPIWDPRSNDDRNTAQHDRVGCQQQVSNSCVQDIHACILEPKKNVAPTPSGDAGFLNPVSHVFTPKEVASLGGAGASLPSIYYAYKKITKRGVAATATAPAIPDEVEDALSINDPEFDPGKSADYQAGSKIRIDNTSNPKLARIKSYLLSNGDKDKSQFVIVDPSDFFDLKLYTPGGKYDSGYKKFDPKNPSQPVVPDTCPIADLNGGYSGICDPSGKAGCNLPIYQVGPTSKFKVADGKTYTYADYRVKWSGYVKKWAVITPQQYHNNIRGREEIYLIGSDVNQNPIIQLTRADEYCDTIERTSQILPIDSSKTQVPPADMPCIQYLQFQDTSGNGSNYAFVDLYSPAQRSFVRKATYNTLQLYELDQYGKPDIRKPISGSGNNKYVGKNTSAQCAGNKCVSFSDKDKQYLHNKKLVKAVYKADYSGAAPVFDSATEKFKGPVLRTGDNQPTIGEYLGIDPKNPTKVDTKAGAGMKLKPGTVTLARLPASNEKGMVFVTANGDEKPVNCVRANVNPKFTNDFFVPTNSNAELNAFLNSKEKIVTDNVEIRPCDAGFLPAKEAQNVGVTANSQKEAIVVLKDAAGKAKTSQNWVGKTSCDQLAARPSCNTVAMISANRYCRLENGDLDNCNLCDGVADPDKDLKFVFAAKGQAVMESTNRCYLRSSCFNISAKGCPSASTAGGHVFCFSADTKISMADGTQKAIKDIKAGEEVVSFNAKSTRNSTLTKAKILASAITENQKIIKINNTNITPLHKIVLANGRAVAAQDIKVGDKMLKANGLVEEVTKIEAGRKPITVYNIVLEEGADGYVANDIRVMSYPILKGMNLASQSPAEEFINRAAASTEETQ